MGHAKQKLKKKLTELEIMKLYDEQHHLYELLDMLLNSLRNNVRGNNKYEPDTAIAICQNYMEKHGYKYELED